MKCINKKTGLCITLLTLCILCGCSSDKEKFTSNYSIYEVDQPQKTEINNQYMANNLCVTEGINFGIDKTDSQVAQAAGLFNITTKETLYCQNIFEQVFPASTTKILTAYIILRDCNLTDIVTISETVTSLDPDSAVCGFVPGDKVSVKDLLYGLLLNSGNDAAIALAEHHSHSIDSFAIEMNETAKEFGATNSNFMNPHGLHDENHYTTVYDMYLIFNQAVQNDDFKEIIQTNNYSCNYTGVSGNTCEVSWNNTNRYLRGSKEAPEGITILGGKTGTTFAAKYCLIILAQNEKGEDVIGLVYKADGSWNLYLLMNQILQMANY